MQNLQKEMYIVIPATYIHSNLKTTFMSYKEGKEFIYINKANF